MNYNTSRANTIRRGENEDNNSPNMPRQGYVKPEKIPEFDDPEFLGDKAWDWAIFITRAEWNNWKGKFETKNKITTHQIRRYYGEFKSIERCLSDNPDNEKWTNNFHKIKLIMAKASYDANRSMNQLPKEFEIFINRCVKIIPADFNTDFKTFKKICLLFEAVVGYSSQYTKE